MRCWILCCFTGAWKGRIGLGPVILARKSDFSHELDTNLKVFFFPKQDHKQD